jgi:hypothetical protein
MSHETHVCVEQSMFEKKKIILERLEGGQ